MGGNKHLYVYEGRTLLETALATLSEVADPVLTIGLELPDRLPGCGPLGGLLTGLERSPCAWNYVLAVDYPALPAAALLALQPVRDATRAVVALGHPLVGLYHRDLASELETYLREGQRRVFGFLASLGDRLETVDGLPGLENLNDPPG